MASISTKVTQYQRPVIIGFILLSTFIFIWLGNPTRLLVGAGTLNGMVLPLALGAMLLVVVKQKGQGNIQHPKWLVYAGWMVVIIMGIMGVRSLFLISL
jgi:Mn2+/Fe2+ NRAMP family transporter